MSAIFASMLLLILGDMSYSDSLFIAGTTFRVAIILFIVIRTTTGNGIIAFRYEGMPGK